MSGVDLKTQRKRSLAEAEAAIAAIRDEDIDLSDIPEWTAEDWTGAVRGKFYRPVKDQVTLRLDRDVLAWFRATEEKYQTAINAALREHMERNRRAS